LSDVLVDLGTSPPSNAYLRPTDLGKPEIFLPLVVYICTNCWLVQIPAHEAPEKIFNDDYAYFSSYSASWVEHARRYSEMMIDRFELGGKSLVVELASNDGYLLQHFKSRGVRVLGVEPAANVARVAEEAGISTRTEFFGEQCARRILDVEGPADLICGANVLAHVPGLHDFVEGMRVLVAPDGVVTMEFPHLVKLIERCQFDTIYHEHYSYLSLHAVSRVFAAHDLPLFDVEELPTHGGSLRVFASRERREPKPGLLAVMQDEQRFGVASLDAYRGFEPRVREIKHGLVGWLTKQARRERSIVGYGAPAKATTLLNYCGIRKDLLPLLLDDSPHKQGKYVPGVRIPIEKPSEEALRVADYVLVMPWNLYDEISTKISALAPGATVVSYRRLAK
jgi:SAM-dependent methyltransferase